MTRIGSLIARALRSVNDESASRDVRAEVLDLTSRFPVPGITRDAART